MYYMLKRRVEQWLCLCGTGLQGSNRQRERQRERKRSAMGNRERVSFTRSLSGCSCRWVVGFMGVFCSFLHFQLPDSIRFDYHLIILFISIFLNSLFAASLWFLIFSSSTSFYYFYFSSSALYSSLCLAVVLVLVVCCCCYYCCYHI